MTSSELFSFIGAPEEPIAIPNDNVWDSLENEVGFAFPVEFKSFLNTYGDGFLGSYIRLCNPSAPGSDRLSKARYDQFFSYANYPFKECLGESTKLYPEKDGWILFGKTLDRTQLLWEPKMNGPWNIIVSNVTDCERYALSFNDFIYRCLSHELKDSYLMRPNLFTKPFFSRVIPGSDLRLVDD